MSTNENTPISGQFWDWMQSYWHTNRDFPPAHPDWRKKADLVDGKVPAGQLPSYVDDVLEFSSYADLPQSGEKGKIYITTKDNKQFRWGGSAYIEINSGENVMTLNTEQSISGRKYFVTSNGSDILNQKLWLRSFDGSNPAAVYYKDGYGSGALGFDGDEFRLTNVGISAYAYLNTKGIKKDRSSDDYFLTGGGGHLDSRTKEDSWFHSSRDFSKGTLIETDVDYSVEYGDQFLLEMKGNMYFDRLPLDAKIQGYIYYGTIIAQSGYSTVSDFNYVIALNFNGKLCFWFPRMAYWQGFDVKLTVGYGGLNQGRNRVINVSDSDDPKGTKRVQINLEKLAFRSWVDKNYLPFTGGSLSGDLALKILKSDVLDGNQIVNAGNQNQLYFGNTSVDTVYHESGNNHIFSNKGNTSFTIDSNGNVTAKNAVNAGNDSEIGGRIFGKRTVIDTLGLDESKYYPVTIQCNSSYPSTIKVYRTLDASMGVPSYSTHGGGFWCYYEFEVYGSGWGTSHFKAICNYQDESWVKNDIKVIGYDQMARSSNVVIYLRGGSKYWLDVNSTSVPSLHTSPFTLYDETVEPTKSRIWSGGILMKANTNDIQKAVNGLENTLRDHVTLNDVQTITARKVISKDLGTNDYINVAQHYGQFQIGKNSDAKSLEFAVLDNGTSVIQSKEVGVGYNPLILNPANNGGVAIAGSPYSGYGLTVHGSTFSRDGFIKEGSNNNYLLLGGGGHVPNTLLTYEDNRTIYPDELAPQKLKFGFTSYDNNNGASGSWADFLHFGGYGDSSGGNQNLLMINRNGFGIRQYQAPWQNNNPYSEYVDFWNTNHFTQANVNSWNNMIYDYVTLGSPQSINARKSIGGAAGNGYSDAALEIRGAGTTNLAIYPTLSFHQPGAYASTLSLRGDGNFHFMDILGTSYVPVKSSGFIKSGSDDNHVLLGGGSHKSVSDFITETSWNNITGKKWFKTDGGNNWDNNTVRIQGINGYDAGLTFYRDGIDVGQIIFDGYNFKTTNSNNDGYKPIISSHFIKSGSDGDHMLLGDGNHKSIYDFATTAQLASKVNATDGALNLGFGGGGSPLALPYIQHSDGTYVDLAREDRTIQAWENAQAIGFNGALSANGVYVYHRIDGYIQIADKNWVTTQLANKVTSVNSTYSIDWDGSSTYLIRNSVNQGYLFHSGNLSPVTLDTPQTIIHQKTFNAGIGLTQGQKLNLAGFGDAAHYIQRFNDDSDGFGISTAFTVKVYNNENTNLFKVGINGQVDLSEGGRLDGYGNLFLQQSSTGGNATGIWWEKNDDSDKIAGIGTMTQDGNFEYFYMGWGSKPWVQANNLSIGTDSILYKNNIVYHAGNFDPNGYQVWVLNQLNNYFNKFPIDYIGASHDLNSLAQTGFYSIAYGTLNSGNYTGPRDGKRALLHFETENIYSASQIQTERYNGNIVSRTKSDGGWSNWVRHWGDNDFTAADVAKWNNSLSTSSASEEVILEDDTLKIQPDEFSLQGNSSYNIGSKKKLVHVLFREGRELNIRDLTKRQTIVVFNFSKDWINLNIEGLKPYPLSPEMQVTLYISDEGEVMLYNENSFKKLQ
ncbi:hypothetical protein QE422_000539 [Chryseobacterium sp. SORGH_AS 447]|uniref:pyocin knob domain-containing protein n=1 Tax=Chryseobacterium sp. SORGH_AS_0447 TaxID=3041769 RepID=UPI00278975A6|nr:pyocin knob domain-containing protein [Chryseobacterium sp. SORGH_AS_0447]MDQ1160171.1 hypothetical protein [Chryseobacterium sp. SORGH_AS_0447]